MKLKYSTVALAAALAAASFGAQASIIGMADLTVNSLLLHRTGDFGATQFLTDTDVTIISGSRTSSAQAKLNGAVISDSQIGGAVGGANAAVQCLGDCGNANLLLAYGGNLSDNTTSHLSMPIVPAVTYALGDSRISGSALSGGAAGSTRANSQLVGPTNDSNANGNLINEVAAKTTFVSAITETVDFRIDYDAFVRTYIDPSHYGVAGSSSALAGNQFTITVFDETDGVKILFAGSDTYKPTELNQLGSTNTAIGGSAKNFASAGIIYSPSVSLIKDHYYSLNIQQNSTVTLRSIPEPGSMLLIGLGLAGLGVAARRRRVK